MGEDTWIGLRNANVAGYDNVCESACDSGRGQLLALLSRVTVRDHSERKVRQAVEAVESVWEEAPGGFVRLEVDLEALVGFRIGQRDLKDLAQPLAALLFEGQLAQPVALDVSFMGAGPERKEVGRLDGGKVRKMVPELERRRSQGGLVIEKGAIEVEENDHAC